MKVNNPQSHDITENLGTRIQQYRLKLNISQADLADKVGLARKTITNLETGRGATLETLISVLNGLGLDPAIERLVPVIPQNGNGSNGDHHPPRRRARRRFQRASV